MKPGWVCDFDNRLAVEYTYATIYPPSTSSNTPHGGLDQLGRRKTTISHISPLPWLLPRLGLGLFTPLLILTFHTVLHWKFDV
jgi:hypothetical protein